MATIIPLRHSDKNHVSTNALKRLAVLLATDMAAVDQMIVSRMQSDVPLVASLADHIIRAGGKRIRPLLALAAARLCGYNGARHHKLAGAVELLHTATLLHDDVVDGSSLRRGSPSANAVFGNQASVLVGDFLLSRAFQLMVEDGSLDVLRILSNASAVISQGEVLQLTAQNDCSTSEQAYLEIVRAKTAELFASACRVGAVVAARPVSEEEALRTFGLNLGIAFQIVDDVLDYAAVEENLGKTVGDDFREGKITLPVILAVSRGDEAERSFWQRVMSCGGQQAGDFPRAQELIVRHEALTDSMARARHYAAIARDSLGLFANSAYKTALLDVIDFTVQREY